MQAIILSLALLTTLIDDRPPAEDVDRWPDLEWLHERMNFNYERYQCVEARVACFPVEAIGLAKRLADIEAENEVLFILIDAKQGWPTFGCESPWPDLDEFRRDKLEELRNRIGPAAYYSGNLFGALN